MPQGKQAICIGLFAALFALLSGCSVSVRPFFDAFEISNQEMPDRETSAAIAQNITMTHATYDLPQATVHVVKINPDAATFSIAVADQLETVEAIARQQNAAAAINAGFFDPQNGKTTSYLFSEGQLIGDPANNERLMENLELQQYLPSILNRSEFRHYRCSQPDGEFDSEFDTYAIARRSDLAPPGCQLHSAIGGGPQLLPTDTSAAEAFTDTQNGELIRDAIGSTGANARSAIGIINSTEEIVLIMAAQREDAPGFTLKEMTDFSETLGVTSLLNLDGGSSSSLYYSDQTYLAKQDAEGNPIERPVKSVIVFK
ncbi:MAG: phosphodiester glycosidase family protein [Cyanobacteria bacterium J06581_3]